jgi:hypothetical protein
MHLPVGIGTEQVRPWQPPGHHYWLLPLSLQPVQASPDLGRQQGPGSGNMSARAPPPTPLEHGPWPPASHR